MKKTFNKKPLKKNNSSKPKTMSHFMTFRPIFLKKKEKFKTRVIYLTGSIKSSYFNNIVKK